ncbi:MAG: Ryanodine receptor Ryr [Sphingobacteriia bacterium]|nr:Ryanodine receptor Ryr [Sphingobacteriia bacterium]
MNNFFGEQEIDVNLIAKRVHETWMNLKLKEGWSFGANLDLNKKEHPNIVPFESLSESDKEVDRQTVMATISYLIENGYTIFKSTTLK